MKASGSPPKTKSVWGTGYVTEWDTWRGPATVGEHCSSSTWVRVPLKNFEQDFRG